MNGILYEEDYIGLFLLVTVIMGGGAAWLAGRAIAATWRPWWHVEGYMLIPFCAVRGHPALAPVLCDRHLGLPYFRLSRLPRDPRGANDHAIRLDQRPGGIHALGAAGRRA
jgi:hypothetical protein